MSATITYTELRDALIKRLRTFYIKDDRDHIKHFTIYGVKWDKAYGGLADYILDMPELDCKVQG